jgi:hypothetical protein
LREEVKKGVKIHCLSTRLQPSRQKIKESLRQRPIALPKNLATIMPKTATAPPKLGPTIAYANNIYLTNYGQNDYF